MRPCVCMPGRRRATELLSYDQQLLEEGLLEPLWRSHLVLRPAPSSGAAAGAGADAAAASSEASNADDSMDPKYSVFLEVS